VLKIRISRVSALRSRWYAIVHASENRLASSYIDRRPIGFTFPQ
jgi:hypothetical protein